MAEKLLKKKKQLEAKGHKLQLAAVCNELGSFYEQQGKYEEARNEYKKGAVLYRELKKPMLYGKSNRMIGEVCTTLAEFDSALSYQQIHLDIARQEKNEQEEQRALATIGRTLLTRAISDPENIDKITLEDAYTSFIQSLELCENLKNISKRDQNDMKVRVYFNIGIIKEHQGEFNRSVEYIKKGINIAEKHCIFEQFHHGHYLLGLFYSKIENFKESLTNLNLALQIAEKFDDKIRYLCTCYLAKSEVLLKMGELSTAKYVLTQAYRLKTPNICERNAVENDLKIVCAMCESEEKLMETPLTDNETRMKLYDILGDGATSLKIPSRAVFYYEKMKECAEACGLTGKDLSPVYISLAQTYKDNKQYQLAYEYFQKDYEVSKSNPEDSYTTLLNIALTLELMNESHDKIVTTYEQTRKEAQSTNKAQAEGKVISQYIEYLKKKGKDSEVAELKKCLDVMNYESDSDSDECVDDSGIPYIGRNINLEEVIGPDSDVEEKKSRRRTKKSYTQNQFGESVLHLACKNGNLNSVKNFLNQGYSINIKDNSGWTPLHEACNFGHFEVVQELLARGASINDREGSQCKGVTPLHDACANGHLEVIELMLNSGASPIMLDDTKQTPLGYLLTWHYKYPLELTNRTLYNKIVNRLEDALKKVGIEIDYDRIKDDIENDAFYSENSTETSKKLKVLLPKTSPRTAQKSPYAKSPHTTSQKSPYEAGSLRYSVHDTETLISSPRFTRNSSFNDDKKRLVKRNLNLTSETSKNDDFSDSSGCDEYRRAIQGLRNRIPENNSQNSRKKESSAFVSDDEYDEQYDNQNWLEDDLDLNKTRKRKRNSNTKQNFLDTNGMRNANSANKSKANTSYSDDDQENNEPSDNECTDNRRSFRNKRKRSQTSLLESGFTRNRSESPLNEFNNSAVTIVDKISSKVYKRQSKMNNFVNNLDTCELETPVNQNINRLLPVNVRIENKLWRIPVPLNEVNDLTIEWLATEASKRYYKQEGILPTLQLLTQEGAILMNEDPLSVVLLTDTKAEELKSNILSWNLPPLYERYIEACSALKIDQCPILKKHFEECQRSLNLKLCNGILNKLQFPPFFRALNRQNNLQHLDLSQINLFDDGVKQLSNILPTLIQLRTLNLSENIITTEGMKYLSQVFSKGDMENLTELNLSYNSFSSESLEYLSIILSKLKLRVLDLCGCNIPKNVFDHYGDDFVLNLSNLDYLNISYNDMNTNDINRFISFLNFGVISTLNVSFNKYVKDSGIADNIFKNLININKISIKHLNLGACKVTDMEVLNLLRELVRTNEIETLNLSFNDELTSASLRRLLQHKPAISNLNLLGCSNIILFFENLETILDSNNQTNFTKSLKISIKYEHKIHEANNLITLWKEKWQKKAQVKKLLGRSILFAVEE